MLKGGKFIPVNGVVQRDHHTFTGTLRKKKITLTKTELVNHKNKLQITLSSSYLSLTLKKWATMMKILAGDKLWEALNIHFRLAWIVYKNSLDAIFLNFSFTCKNKAYS